MLPSRMEKAGAPVGTLPPAKLVLVVRFDYFDMAAMYGLGRPKT